jgi:hypothetical protein
MALQADILKQLDAVIAKHRDLRSRSEYDDCSDQPEVEPTALATLICDTIARLAPSNSHYVDAMKSIVQRLHITNTGVIPHLAGVLHALRGAYDAGYLASVTELIHTDIFADFVEMADHLLSAGYKDAAAVIIGSTLEEHLRQLCVKNGIPTDAGGKPKRSDALNAELAARPVYSKLDQKLIIAWLGLRNSAAHGKYGEYSKEQVANLLEGVRGFMARVPA